MSELSVYELEVEYSEVLPEREALGFFGAVAASHAHGLLAFTATAAGGVAHGSTTSAVFVGAAW